MGAFAKILVKLPFEIILGFVECYSAYVWQPSLPTSLLSYLVNVIQTFNRILVIPTFDLVSIKTIKITLIILYRTKIHFFGIRMVAIASNVPPCYLAYEQLLLYLTCLLSHLTRVIWIFNRSLVIPSRNLSWACSLSHDINNITPAFAILEWICAIFDPVLILN